MYQDWTVETEYATNGNVEVWLNRHVPCIEWKSMQNPSSWEWRRSLDIVLQMAKVLMAEFRPGQLQIMVDATEIHVLSPDDMEFSQRNIIPGLIELGIVKNAVIGNMSSLGAISYEAFSAGLQETKLPFALVWFPSRDLAIKWLQT